MTGSKKRGRVWRRILPEAARPWRNAGIVFSRSGVSAAHRLEAQRHRVDAIALPCLGRAVGKDVSQMGFATTTAHFDTSHAMAGVEMLFDGGIRIRPIRKLGQPQPASNLVSLSNSSASAGNAVIVARCRADLVIATERAFGTGFTCDAILLRRQTLAPILFHCTRMSTSPGSACLARSWSLLSMRFFESTPARTCKQVPVSGNPKQWIPVFTSTPGTYPKMRGR